MDGRTQIFQKLKPPCVALGDAARTLNGPEADVNNVAERLENLKGTLSDVTHSLDEQLADYAFFPLALVLKASQKVSIRCLELALQCLAILIAHGWRSRIQSETAVQIAILCTMMASKKPTGLASTSSTDELQASALRCLQHLFSVLDKDSEITARLTSEAHMPQLGMTISTILEAVLEGDSVEVQTAAAHALKTLLENVTTRDIQAAFLPGIVSKLTQVLTPQTKRRRNHAILTICLAILHHLFANTLGAEAVNVAASHDIAAKQKATATSSTVITTEWLESAAAQLKPAVAKIVRLRDHDRIDVRESLAQFCFTLLKQCRRTLANCVSLALETLLSLSSDQAGDSIKFRLESLLTAEPSLADQVLDRLYDWHQSLTTKMQSADDQAKVQMLRQMTTAFDIVTASGADTSTVDRLLADTLRDSVVITLQLPSLKRQANPHVSPVNALSVTNLEGTRHNVDFASPLVKYAGQKAILDTIGSFAQTISKASSSAALLVQLARSLRQSQGDAQIASFWLLLNAIETTLGRGLEIDAFLAVDLGLAQSYMPYLEDMYSFSLGILTASPDEPVDERLQALALRTLALRSRTAGEEFRYELIDALYPVLHTLATPNEQLQQDSITTLNVFTASCGYASVKDLVVENVDYLTNAVALKLNSFDVSPQAPQVLLMMVRLAGPSLLPYLGDTIDSIFAALEDYHGYPLLVELLFKVLSAVAEEGVKTPQLAITQTPGETTLSAGSTPRLISIASLAESLRDRALEEKQTMSVGGQPESHPKQPWKASTSAEEDLPDEDSDNEATSRMDPELPPPAPKQFELLLKISELTQHFLPSASASLRASLLALIKTTAPALAKHENSFLPLVNTLWPEVVSRLDDAESHVVSNALDIIAVLCEQAQDFMRSRILQLWPSLVEMHQRTAEKIIHISRSRDHARENARQHDSEALASNVAPLKQALIRMQRTPTDYSDTSVRTMWDSIVHTIATIVEYVELPSEQFDEALIMLEPVIEQDHIRKAFEKHNADAVWLVRLRSGLISLPNVANLDIGSYNLAATPG
ncbi:TEL2-interacting 1 [Lecanosticta acicola]|uniref:TEL2-interacting 1 n=1 Tax=Lecanosticta acicola TaxID=111012 RepID=A0AAI9EBH7_9PEZI|nr:TEL2-interacting 1 [Lecanosticta acicola]